MKTFEKSSKLDYVGYDIRGPVVDEADKMIQQGVEILKLNTGNPAPFGFEAPEYVTDSIVAHIKESQGYSHSKGILSAREAILSYSKIKQLPNVGVDDIFTGNGVSELIMIAMQALLNTGDEILIPMPDYPLWTAAATLSGGNVVHYVCDEQAEWIPDIQDIKNKITANTKAIVIINPNNPTGALYPVDLLQRIVDVAREHQLIIFADEIYDRMLMNGFKHTSIASLAPDLFVVTFNGLSKSHRVAGFRCGWMCLSGEKKQAAGYISGINMLASMRLCSNVLSQSIIEESLKDYNSADPLMSPGGRIYEQSAYVTRRIAGIAGLSVVKPKAAFYIFPKLDTTKFKIKDDEQFVVDFLKQKHILMTHGGGFHWPQPDHFRLVFLPELEVLTRVMDALEEFLTSYGQ